MRSIAIPSSTLINETDEKIKTYKIGLIGRAAAIFRIDEIFIYRDPKLDESKFISDILRYMETPQYLRKDLIPIKSSLKFAGVLPPLQIPSHKPKHVKIGEIREGLVKKIKPNGTALVDIGLDTYAILKSTPRKKRITVKVISKEPLIVSEAKPNDYWGYKVKITELSKIVNKNTAIITSRKCKYPDIEELKKYSNDFILIFGSPEEGVFEIAKRIGVKIKNKPCWNLIPDQGVKTVRLEEAIFSSLAILNYISRL